MDRDSMKFAPLSPGDLKKIQDAENQLNSSQKSENEIILLAYSKKST